MFQAEISLGNVLSIGLTLISSTVLVVGFVWAIRSSVTVLNVRLTNTQQVIAEVKDEIRKLSEVITTQAVQNQRLDGMVDMHQQFDRRIMLQGERIDRLETRVTQALDTHVRGRS